MNTRALQDLLEAIIANPDDDDARLVYADALTSMNDPRGEFIVVQVALAKLGVSTLDDIIEAPPETLSDADAARAGALLRRQNELLAEHARTWVEALLGERARGDNAFFDFWRLLRFRRGFVNEMPIAGPDEATRICELSERRLAPPLETILITGAARDAEVVRLGQAGSLHHLRAIKINSTISSDTFKRLLDEAPELERIEDSNGAGTLGKHLEAATNTKLRSLAVGGLTPELVMLAPAMRSLRSLDLHYYGDRAIDFLDVSVCPELEEVNVSSSGSHWEESDPWMGRYGVFEVSAAFKNREPLPKLKKLRLMTSHGGKAFHEVLDSKIASTIEEIEIVGHKDSERLFDAIMASRSITKADFGEWKAESLASLTTQPRRKSFEKMCISVSSSMDERTLEAFLSNNSSLRVLKLGGVFGTTTHEGKMLDVLSKHAPASLRSLTLVNWDLTNDELIGALVSAPQLSSLRALRLHGGNKQGGAMGDGGACVVSEAPMPNLVTIDLNGNEIRDRGTLSFHHAKEHFPALAWLTVGMSANTTSYTSLSGALGPLFVFSYGTDFSTTFFAADWFKS